MAIWVFKEGNREGPYTEEDVRELIYEGTYTDADLAETGDDATRRTLGEILRRPGGTEVAALAGTSAAAPSSPLTPPPLPAGTPAPVPPALPPRAAMPVSVVDFQMPFGSMVLFMIKWALAAVPAMLILAAVFAMFWTVILTAAAALFHR